jgi:hypothetical protein
MRAEKRKTAVEIRDLEVVDDDRTTFINEDMAIHKLIYRATGHSHLEDVLVRYDNVATRIWCLVIDKLPDLAKHVQWLSNINMVLAGTLALVVFIGGTTRPRCGLDRWTRERSLDGRGRRVARSRTGHHL